MKNPWPVLLGLHWYQNNFPDNYCGGPLEYSHAIEYCLIGQLRQLILRYIFSTIRNFDMKCIKIFTWNILCFNFMTICKFFDIGSDVFRKHLLSSKFNNIVLYAHVCYSARQITLFLKGAGVSSVVFLARISRN